MSGSVTRKGTLGLLGSGLTAGLSLLVGIMLARLMPPAELGAYSNLVSFVALVAGLLGLGLGSAGIYFIRRKNYPYDAVRGVLIRASAVIAILVFLVTVASGIALDSFFGGRQQTEIVLAACYGSTMVLITNLMPLFHARMRVEYPIMANSMIMSCMMMGLLLLFLVEGPILELALVSLLCAHLFGLSFVLVKSRVRDGQAGDIGESPFLDLAKYGLKMNLGFVVYLLIGELAILGTRALTDDFDEVAFVRLALRLSTVLLIVSNAIRPVLFSHWSSNLDGNVQQVEHACRYVFMLALAGGSGMVLIGPWLIPLLYGSDYEPTVVIFQIFVLGMCFRLLGMPFHAAMSGSGRGRTALLAHVDQPDRHGAVDVPARA